MTSGLAWLNELMLWIGRWFPRLVLVKATHHAVKFSGPSMTLIKPGLCWYWPITSSLQLVSMRSRSIETAAQLLGREVIAVVVGFTIVDPLAVMSEFAEVFSQLDDRTKSAVARAYTAEKSSAAIAEEVKGELSGRFSPHGVTIQKVDVVQRGRVIPLKNLNDWAQHSKANLDPDVIEEKPAA